MTEPLAVPGLNSWLWCDACRRMWQMTAHDFLVQWLRGTEVRCACGTRLALWPSLIAAVDGNQFSMALAALLGGGAQFIDVVLRRDEHCVVRLSDHGVPEDAHILDVTYSPQGPGFFPREWHGNASMEPRDHHELALWPVPYDSGIDETRCAIAVSWVPAAADDARGMLVEAARRFRTKDFEGSVVWAHTALDHAFGIALRPLLVASVVTRSARDQPRLSFLGKFALFQSVVAANGARPLPAHTSALLADLNKRRNDIAHPPKNKQPLDRDVMVQIIAASVLTLTTIEVLTALINATAERATQLVGTDLTAVPE